MSEKTSIKIKVGRKLGYNEYCRVWKRSSGRSSYGLQEFGNWISPNGKQWRPCGLYYPGVLLVHWPTGQKHSVDYGTLLRMELLGWTWRPDERGNMPQFKIQRWPDGEHYYLLKMDGDPIGKGKFDTYDQAHKAGIKWAVTQSDPYGAEEVKDQPEAKE